MGDLIRLIAAVVFEVWRKHYRSKHPKRDGRHLRRGRHEPGHDDDD